MDLLSLYRFNRAIMSKIYSRTLYGIARSIQDMECKIITTSDVLENLDRQKEIEKHLQAKEKLQVLVQALDVLRNCYSSELIQDR